MDNYQAPVSPYLGTINTDNTASDIHPSVWTQMCALFKMFQLSLYRDWKTTAATTIQLLIITAITCLVFKTISLDLIGIKARQNMLYISVTLTTYVSMVMQ